MQGQDDPKGALDDRIARLAGLSTELAGRHGRLLHRLHLELLRPGPGIWLQPRQQAGEDPSLGIPPWPDQGEEEDEDLEGSFQDVVDRIEVITEEQLDALARGEEDVEGEQLDPDLSGPGDLGSGPLIPSDDWPWRHTQRHPGGWLRAGSDAQLPECGQLWLLWFSYWGRVADCDGIDLEHAYDATLLRACAEAFRLCREAHDECPSARLWMLEAKWRCGRHDTHGLVVGVSLDVAVACVAG